MSTGWDNLSGVMRQLVARAERQQRDTGDPDQGVDNAAERRSLTAKEGSNQIKLSESDEPPVQGPDDDQNESQPFNTSRHDRIPWKEWVLILTIEAARRHH
jgi:hypothetical protein